MKLFGGTPLARRFAAGEKLSDAQLAIAKSKVGEEKQGVTH